jgi:hypothetical protein
MRRLRRRYGRRYGRAWAAESVITRPAGGGLYDVVLVDSRGGLVRTLHRRVPYGEAVSIVRRSHS